MKFKAALESNIEQLISGKMDHGNKTTGLFFVQSNLHAE